MKRTHKPTPKTVRALKALGITVVGLATMRAAQATTSIHFEGLPHNTDILQSFADNASANGTGFNVSAGLFVTGTPNVDITWGPGSGGVVDSYQNWDGRGTVAQLDFNRPIGTGSTQISLTFTPDPGWWVLINSFDMDEYSGGGSMDIDWNISDSGGMLASGNWQRSTGGRDTINPVYSRDAIPGGAVTLTFIRNSGTGSYFAIDNLVFDQVPEPSTVALATLAGLGLGAAAMRRRK